MVDKTDDGFQSRVDTRSTDTQLNYASATITSSFWNAGVEAGLTGNQIMQLAGIFGWDIDFALDIRGGDKFEVLYEEQFVEGEHVGSGEILAASFTNQGETFTAIRAESGKYYDENGRAMRKAFLRSPLSFRYVSSNFNPRRLHPVTGKVKAHRVRITSRPSAHLFGLPVMVWFRNPDTTNTTETMSLSGIPLPISPSICT